jgi:hypothetical protein
MLIKHELPTKQKGIKNELNINRFYTEIVVYITTRSKECEDM